MDWKHYQTVDPLQKEPQVGRGLFGIRLLSVKPRENILRVYPRLKANGSFSQIGK